MLLASCSLPHLLSVSLPSCSPQVGTVTLLLTAVSSAYSAGRVMKQEFNKHLLSEGSFLDMCMDVLACPGPRGNHHTCWKMRIKVPPNHLTGFSGLERYETSLGLVFQNCVQKTGVSFPLHPSSRR